MRCLCIPSWLFFLSTPNSRHYPQSFSKPPMWSHCPTPSLLWQPMSKLRSVSEASSAASQSVIHLKERHSSEARLDQMTMISSMEAQRWEAWPTIRSAPCPNCCRSECMKSELERLRGSTLVDPVPEQFLGKFSFKCICQQVNMQVFLFFLSS